MEEPKDKFKANNYGEVLAAINQMELISFEEEGDYEGYYLAVLKDNQDGEERLFYYIGSYGSCSGCDWLESVSDYDNFVPLKEALDYVAELKPKYIVPASMPLKFEHNESYYGWKLIL